MILVAFVVVRPELFVSEEALNTLNQNTARIDFVLVESAKPNANVKPATATAQTANLQNAKNATQNVQTAMQTQTANLQNAKNATQNVQTSQLNTNANVKPATATAQTANLQNAKNATQNAKNATQNVQTAQPNTNAKTAMQTQNANLQNAKNATQNVQTAQPNTNAKTAMQTQNANLQISQNITQPQPPKPAQPAKKVAPKPTLKLATKHPEVKVAKVANRQNEGRLTFPHRLLYRSYSVVITPEFAGTKADITLKFMGQYTAKNKKQVKALTQFEAVKLNGKTIVKKERAWHNEPFVYTLKNVKSGVALNLEFSVKQPLVMRDINVLSLVFTFFGVAYMVFLLRVVASSGLKLGEFAAFVVKESPCLFFVFVLNFALLIWMQKLAFVHACAIFAAIFLLLHVLFLTKEKVARIGVKVLFWACFVLFLVESFLVVSYQMLFDKLSLLGIRQTDVSEASEFLAAYTNLKILSVWALTLAFGAVLLWLSKKEKLFAPSQKRTKFILLSYAFFGCITAVLLTRDIQPLWGLNFTRFALVNSLDKRQLFKNEDEAVAIFKTNREMRAKFRGQIHAKNSPKKVILVIGESHQRAKFSLYGYYLDTTPNLKRLEKSGNLVAFNDVVSSYPTTYAVLNHLLDFSNRDGVKTGLDVVSLFGFAGFKTRFVSQQAVTGTWEAVKQTTLSKNADFFVKTQANNEKILSEFKKNDEREFYLVHLYGAHARYADRYPKHFVKFGVGDVREKFSNEQKRVVSEYANANFFTDHLVGQIWEQFKDEDAVMVFLSDHGESVYDDRANFFGHSNDFATNYEIPFVVVMSDAYKARRGEMFAATVAAREKPFVNDDTIHVLATLGGVVSPEYDARRDVLSGKFNKKRKRIVGFNGRDYDKELAKNGRR